MVSKLCHCMRWIWQTIFLVCNFNFVQHNKICYQSFANPSTDVCAPSVYSMSETSGLQVGKHCPVSHSLWGYFPLLCVDEATDFNLVTNQSRGHAKKQVKCSSTSKRVRVPKSRQKTLRLDTYHAKVETCSLRPRDQNNCDGQLGRQDVHACVQGLFFYIFFSRHLDFPVWIVNIADRDPRWNPE